MPSLGYKKQFAPLVESGEKRQTIRAMRKRPFKVGDRLYHYYGLRTKQCRKLLESRCTVAFEINITVTRDIVVEDMRVPTSGLIAFAERDGFRGDENENAYLKMIRFFRETHGLPFEGQLIRW